jgi:stage II sporulation protein D
MSHARSLSPAPRATRRVVTALAGGALVVGALAATSSEHSSAAVSVDQVYAVPSGGTFTVRGHGYGHGNGMSQHGAQGAAQKGLSAQQILGFYYPGTSSAVVKAKKIRVLITADTSDPVEVLPRSGLQVRDLGARKTYVLPTNLGATRWRISVASGNRDVVHYLSGGSWRLWRPGGQDGLQGLGQFASPDGPVTLQLPSGRLAYRGALRAAAPSPTSTSRNTVNVVRLDDYVRGVIPSEMPPLWHPNAVRAQAVAARTYAAFDRAAHASRYYHTCDTTSCQVYAGTSKEHPASNDAADATAGQIRTYQGKPAFTQFSASSGGWTSSGGFPYLRSKEDPYDKWSGNSHHDWSVSLTATRIRDAYPSIGRLLRVRVTKREGGGEWQGRVEALVLEGTQGKRTLSGDEFRWRFGLRSTWFRL